MTTSMNAVLSSEAQAIVQDKKLKGRRRYDQWIPLLRELEQFDALNDEAIKKTKKRVAKFVGGGIICLFLSFFIPIISVLTGSLTFCCFAAAVILGLKAKKLNSFDLENDLRLTILPFLDAIKDDVQPKGKITLDLNLLNTIHAQNKQPSRNLPTQFRKLVETPFRQQICAVKVPLVNGITLLLDISREALRFDRTYTSRSGKIKNKRKWKLNVTVAAGLIPDGEMVRYDSEAIGNLAADQKVKQKGEACQLVRRFKFKSINSAPPEQSVEPGDIIAMFMTLCKTLKSAQKKEG